MLGLGVNRLGSPRKGGFSLRKLFKATSSGFLGAINDATTLSQSSSSSVAVTSAGDPIGRESRVLGSFDLTQATSANRATWARRPRSGIRNRVTANQMAGTVAGTPGTITTDWTFISLSSGLSRTVVGTGTEDGIKYIEIRVFGTTLDTNGVSIGLAAVAALTGETWTNSCYHKLVAGSMTGATNVQIGVIENTSGGGFVSGAFYTQTNPTSAALSTQRPAGTRAFIGGATVGQNASVYKINIPPATTVDFTIRIGEPQVEKASAVSALQHVTVPYNITEDGQPDVYHSYYDGVSDYLTSGVQSFGTASLFAAAGQAWTVWGTFRTLATGAGVIFSKASGTGANKTLQFTVSAGTLNATVRGTDNNSILSLTTINDGNFHTFSLRWNGSTLQVWVDGIALTASLTVGTAVEEAQNIVTAIRTESSPAGYFNGHNDVSMIDRALTDTEVTALMKSLNQTYRYGL